MNAATILTPMQILLVWTLLGMLLTWLVVFAVLALRSSTQEKADPKDLPTPSRSFPALTAPATLHIMTTSPVGGAVPVAAMVGAEASNDPGYPHADA
jgi:predicted secreted protein